jgi:peroxisomal 3,2-trans-enoyl-CoA isomerase
LCNNNIIVLKASELLYFNQKITAVEAERCGLVTQVFPNDRFQAETGKRIQEMAELPVKVSNK